MSVLRARHHLCLMPVLAVAAFVLLPVGTADAYRSGNPPTLQSVTVDAQRRLVVTYSAPDGVTYGGRIYFDSNPKNGEPPAYQSTYGNAMYCSNNYSCMKSWTLDATTSTGPFTYTSEALELTTFPGGTYYTQVETTNEDPFPSTRYWEESNVMVVELPAKAPLPSCSNRTGGAGYSDLSDPMKESLGKLYAALDGADACYTYNSGYRSHKDQARLFRKWHLIARNKGPNDHRTCAKVRAQLVAAGLRNELKCRNNYIYRNRNGVARGGPARPGTSRHEFREAADLNVWFPVDEKLTKCAEGFSTGSKSAPIKQRCPSLARLRLAATSSGLCGPSAGDRVHVELPYVKRGKSGCHFV